MKSIIDKYGPVNLSYRLSVEEYNHELTKLKKKNFCFKSLFPRTSYFLITASSSGFRWFSYKRGSLRVCLGRSSKNRECPFRNICKQWTHVTITSLHDLFCAIEASWVDCDPERPLAYGKLGLHFIDSDFDPSHLLPDFPKTLHSKTTSETIKLKYSSFKAIRYLIITNEYLFSIHKERRVSK